MTCSDIGMIGLAVMGENLAVNMASKGYSVVGFDVDRKRARAFAEGQGKSSGIRVADSLSEMVDWLTPPRKIMMMIKAGTPVDETIDALLPLLTKGDVVIDGGNSHFPDTMRRTALLEKHGLLFIGTGVSGGEEGALTGPSIMPGGSPDAWPIVQPILTAIAAKTDDGFPCCEWVGENGAGHFVKMVHNGIEYGDIQLIAESYQLMRDRLGMTPAEIGATFQTWNQTELDSYLIGITADIFAFRDVDGSPLIDRILDVAGQKGTGKWTAISSFDEGVPLTLIGEAVYARFLSAMKDQRLLAAASYRHKIPRYRGDRVKYLEQLRCALYASKITSYAQGYALMTAAARTYGWNLNYGGIALIWRGGCIIRSAFLGKIKEAYVRNPQLLNLLLDPYFHESVKANDKSWRNIVADAVRCGVAVPSLASALHYLDGYVNAQSPANLIQAQRDYFGAHTYERTDRPRGESFHTNWTGHGGTTSSTTYNA